MKVLSLLAALLFAAPSAFADDAARATTTPLADGVTAFGSLVGLRAALAHSTASAEDKASYDDNGTKFLAILPRELVATADTIVYTQDPDKQQRVMLRFDRKDLAKVAALKKQKTGAVFKVSTGFATLDNGYLYWSKQKDALTHITETSLASDDAAFFASNLIAGLLWREEGKFLLGATVRPDGCTLTLAFPPELGKQILAAFADQAKTTQLDFKVSKSAAGMDRAEWKGDPLSCLGSITEFVTPAVLRYGRTKSGN